MHMLSSYRQYINNATYYLVQVQIIYKYWCLMLYLLPKSLWVFFVHFFWMRSPCCVKVKVIARHYRPFLVAQNHLPDKMFQWHYTCTYLYSDRVCLMNKKKFDTVHTKVYVRQLHIWLPRDWCFPASFVLV